MGNSAGFGERNAIYIQTATAAAALADTIAASGVDPISKPQLDRMIDAVIAEGIARPDTIAEAASWTTVDDQHKSGAAYRRFSGGVSLTPERWPRVNHGPTRNGRN